LGRKQGRSAVEPPAYDSGWQSYTQGETKTLVHNLGGDYDDYVVDLTCRGSAPLGTHNYGVGGDKSSPPLGTEHMGAYWRNLGTTSIEATRLTEDPRCLQIRIRIWVYQ
jgi:hypothetical protein